jgi:hypothetical protein
MSVIGVVLAGVSLGTTWADASPTAGRLVPRSRSSTAPAPSRPWRSSFSFATSSRCSCRAGAYGRPGSLADDRPFLCAVDVHGCGDADTHAALAPLDRRGRTGCRSIQAAAALGSIAGTFLAGFVLISAFGTRRIVAGVAVTLLVLAVAARPPLLRRRLLELGAILAAIVTIGWTSYSP